MTKLRLGNQLLCTKRKGSKAENKSILLRIFIAKEDPEGSAQDYDINRHASQAIHEEELWSKLRFGVWLRYYERIFGMVKSFRQQKFQNAYYLSLVHLDRD